MKHYFHRILRLYALLSFISFTLYGQHTIKGNVRDQRNERLPFVTIILKAEENTLKTEISDELGNFKFDKLNIKHYQLLFSIVGYQKKDTVLSALTDTTNLEIVLKSEIIQLREVSVLARKKVIERQSDKIIFNVENSLTATGSDGLETISKAPGVRIVKNVITLIGKSGVGIMINGQLLSLSGEELSNFLKNISSDDISKIEIITNPTAEYDAQGGGLINIITKPFYRTGLYSQFNSRFQQSTFTTLGMNSKVNYRGKKINILSSIDLDNGSILETKEPITYYRNQMWREFFYSRDYSKKRNLRLEVNYFLSSKTTIGGSLYYNVSSPSSIVKDKIAFNTIETDSILSTNSQLSNKTTSKTAQIHFQHLIDTLGKELNIDFNLFGKENNYTNDFTSSHAISDINYPYLTKNIGILNSGNIHLYTIKANIKLPLKWFLLSVGGKLSSYNSDNLSLSRNENIINNQGLFTYKERIHSAFINIKRSTEKWVFQMGIRNESTSTTSFSESTKQTYTNIYNNLFPTGNIQYQPNNNNTISLNYNKRIERPNYSFLNPLKIFSNPYVYQVGNPRLLPSYTHSVELSHTFKNSLTSSIGLDISRNTFDIINLFDEQSKLQETTYLNFLTVYRYRAGISWICNSLSWLESNNQLMTVYNNSKSNILQKQSLTGWDISLNSDNQFILNKSKTLMGNLLYLHQFPWVYDAFKISSYSEIDVGLKALILKNRLQISLLIEDIFKTMKMTYLEQTNSIQQQTLYYSDNRRLKLTLKYSLGKEKNKKDHSELINKEETERMKLK